MLQHAVGSLRENISSRSPAWKSPAPSLGLRGGLGKTLLTAFLLLAIAPLGLLSFLTYRQIQADTGQKLLASLETIVTLKEANLVDWVQSYERELALLASAPALEEGALGGQAEYLAAWLAAFQAADPTLKALIVMDEAGEQVVAVPDSARGAVPDLWPELAGQGRLLLATARAGSGTGLEQPGTGLDPLVAVSYRAGGRWLVGLLDWGALQEIVAASDGHQAGMSTWLVTAEGLAASAGGWSRLVLGSGEPESVGRVLEGESGSVACTGLEGVPVYAAYRWIPALGAGLLAEYPQATALAAGNTATAMVVGATLAVALITAAIAAVVTRRLTVPIVQLTEKAARMARGDLNQKVAVARQDEIGVLARAFNRMAAELQALYAELEDKVVERTRQLEEAHEQTRYYAMQLSISAEVARIASSIRNLDELLPTVVKLIGDAFELHHVAIYLLDSSGQRARWAAGSNGRIPSEEEVVGGLSLVGQVAADGRCRVLRWGARPRAREQSALTEAPIPVNQPAPAGFLEAGAGPRFAREMALPLRAGKTMLGVLHLQSEQAGELDSSDEMVYQSLADQISIAIENARAYGVERETVRRLQELDRIQSEFLTNMSHALRTPLNSAIGFSRIMLKGLDGPLTDLQRADLTTVYDSGRQLLGLIDDMLELSQLELGMATVSPGEVHLAEIVQGVMATGRALARGKPVRLYEEVPAGLPPLHTDGQRVRQVILALLANAVKFTAEGSVWLRVAAGDDFVTIRVTATRTTIRALEPSGILAGPPRDPSRGQISRGDAADRASGAGAGLAIGKRAIERLGGQIWLESEEGAGSTVAFRLPWSGPPQELERGVTGNAPEA